MIPISLGTYGKQIPNHRGVEEAARGSKPDYRFREGLHYALKLHFAQYIRRTCQEILETHTAVNHTFRDVHEYRMNLMFQHVGSTTPTHAPDC